MESERPGLSPPRPAQRREPPAPRAIVLARLSHLGDVVHALPVFHALRELHPSAAIAWIVEPAYAELVRTLPGLARAFPFGRRDGARAWWRLGRALADFRADLAVDAQGNWKSAAATRLTRARARVGLDARDWREPSAAWVLTERAPPADGPHAVDRMRALARHLSGRVDRPVPEISFDLALDPAEIQAAERRCDELLGAEPGRILHLASESDVRSWPAAAFGKLALELAERGERVVLLSGPEEVREGQRLARELPAHPSIAHWTGQRGLRELAAFFGAAARRGGGFVGCDSGPMHLAAAAGLPVTLLAGPQDARRTGPWPTPGRDPASPHRVVASSSPPACAPCRRRHCHHAEGPVCMRSIEPARVAENLPRVLDAARR